MKNHNFVGLVIMLLVVLAAQSIIGVVKLGYDAAKGVYSMAKPQSVAMLPSATYAPIFEVVEAAPFVTEAIADPWGEVLTAKARKPRKRSMAQLIQEIAS